MGWDAPLSSVLLQLKCWGGHSTLLGNRNVHSHPAELHFALVFLLSFFHKPLVFFTVTVSGLNKKAKRPFVIFISVSPFGYPLLSCSHAKFLLPF